MQGTGETYACLGTYRSPNLLRVTFRFSAQATSVDARNKAFKDDASRDLRFCGKLRSADDSTAVIKLGARTAVSNDRFFFNESWAISNSQTTTPIALVKALPGHRPAGVLICQVTVATSVHHCTFRDPSTLSYLLQILDTGVPGFQFK